MRTLLLCVLIGLGTLCDYCAAQSSAASNILIGEQDAPSVQLCQLLFYEKVRRAVHLQDEPFTQLTALLSTLKAQSPDPAQFASLSFDERFRTSEKLQAAAKAIDQQVWDSLVAVLKPSDLRALMGAHINYFGPASILNPRIAKELQITDEQHKVIAQFLDEHRRKRRSLLSDIANRKANTQLSDVALNTNALRSEISKLLNKTQRMLLENMLADGDKLVTVEPHLSLGW